MRKDTTNEVVELLNDVNAIEVDSRTYSRLKRIAGLIGADDQQDTMVRVCRLIEFLEKQMEQDGFIIVRTKHDKKMKKLLLSQPTRENYEYQLFAREAKKTRASK